MSKFEKQLDQYMYWCENIRRMSPQTIHNRKWVCKSLKESISISNIKKLTNKHVNDWINEQIERGVSGRTINMRVASLMAMTSYFEEINLEIPKLNKSKIRKQKEAPCKKIYYSREQIEQVLKCANDIEWLLIKICFDCGLRITELRNLRLSNIDGNKITFIGKGQKLREAYIEDDTRIRLERWIEDNKITNYLWVVKMRWGKYHHITVETVRHFMARPFHQMGYDNFHPHALRHSFATDIVNNGAPIYVAKEMLGHSNITTTERYVHSFDGQLEDLFTQYKFTTR